MVSADSTAAPAIANRKGAGKLRHVNISPLWIQERQALHDVEMRKVLGTENPADLMTKYLARPLLDRHVEFLHHDRATGRAKSGLDIQGKSKLPPTAAPASTTQGKPGVEPNSRPTSLVGNTQGELRYVGKTKPSC